MTQPEGTPEGGAPCWGAGFLPARPSGDALPQRARRRSSTSSRPAEFTPDQQRRTLDLLRSMNEDGPRPGRHRAVGADRHLRAGLPDAERGARGRRPLARDGRDQRELYGLNDPRTAEFGTRCLLARRLVERGRPVRPALFGRRPGGHAVGRPRRHRRQPREDVRPDRPARRRPADRPEADRPARRHPGRSGAPSSAGRPSARGAAGAATTTRPASPCGWPAAASRAGRVVGATDEIGLNGDRGPGPRQRHPRHDPPPDGPRPQAADLPPQRPRRAADRRRRQGDQEADRLSRMRHRAEGTLTRPSATLSQGRGE